MEIFLKIGDVFGWFAAIVTVFLGLPQLIKLLKEKSVGKVKFVSFWIFYWGLFAWILFGTFLPGGLIQVAFANLLCIFIYSAVIFCLYYYDKTIGQKKNNKELILTNVTVILGIFCVLSTIITIYGIIPNTPKIHNKIVQTILGIIVPSFTCLAFMPQVLYSFKTKNFAGISVYMILMFILNNIFWIIYWVSRLVDNNNYALDISLGWQIFSLIIFSVQIIFTIQYYVKLKKAK
ncbi:PQ-loop domain-containing transporter [Mycoplasma miroungirhinis]|uniref:PQ loop repeat n=1 Tax=Mycoplasma miroungirhinis TaxID=754516 RepID=A0A6M4JEC5_9MOLU|nr:PQ-loop domain-containing transporter [Mycoplasma miroungirhinis]QJR44359.1 hypothetical protein HLA92_02890 [Mycoplasma miroungirhinis]